MNGGNNGPLRTLNIASNVTLSSAYTLPPGLDFFGIQIPTMASGTDVYLQGSLDGTTFYRVRWSAAGTGVGTTTPAQVFVNSSVTQALVPLNPPAVKQVKIELSTAMTATSCNIVLFGSH
jgi:hypothetical protein